MTIISKITILKPIDEVVKYVLDVHTWSRWGVGIDGAGYVESGVIDALYSDGLYALDSLAAWSVVRDSSVQPQTLTFELKSSGDVDGENVVIYTFQATRGGAATKVTRDSLPGGFLQKAEKLLSNLKKSLEAVPAPQLPGLITDPEGGDGVVGPLTSSGHGPP